MKLCHFGRVHFGWVPALMELATDPHGPTRTIKFKAEKLTAESAETAEKRLKLYGIGHRPTQTDRLKGGKLVGYEAGKLGCWEVGRIGR